MVAVIAFFFFVLWVERHCCFFPPIGWLLLCSEVEMGWVFGKKAFLRFGRRHLEDTGVFSGVSSLGVAKE
jgi:hypothetical protein